MAQILTKKYRTFIDCHGKQTDPMYDYDVSTTYHHADDGAEYDTVNEVVAEIVDNNKFDVPALPKAGTLVNKGELYTDDGKVYRVRQSHKVTIYDPDDIPALFTVYRKETSDMNWIDGEQVDKGTIRTYDGKTYECMQAHQTQSDWTPTATIGVLWKLYVDPGGEIPVWKQPTGAHDAYNKGDQVYFPTDKDDVYESVIDANVWSPTGYPAGWKKI